MAPCGTHTACLGAYMFGKEKLVVVYIKHIHHVFEVSCAIWNHTSVFEVAGYVYNLLLQQHQGIIMHACRDWGYTFIHYSALFQLIIIRAHMRMHAFNYCNHFKVLAITILIIISTARRKVNNFDTPNSVSHVYAWLMTDRITSSLLQISF